VGGPACAVAVATPAPPARCTLGWDGAGPAGGGGASQSMAGGASVAARPEHPARRRGGPGGGAAGAVAERARVAARHTPGATTSGHRSWAGHECGCHARGAVIPTAWPLSRALGYSRRPLSPPQFPQAKPAVGGSSRGCGSRVASVPGRWVGSTRTRGGGGGRAVRLGAGFVTSHGPHRFCEHLRNCLRPRHCWPAQTNPPRARSTAASTCDRAGAEERARDNAVIQLWYCIFLLFRQTYAKNSSSP
jgi:hypothetical protein